MRLFRRTFQAEETSATALREDGSWPMEGAGNIVEIRIRAFEMSQIMWYLLRM